MKHAYGYKPCNYRRKESSNNEQKHAISPPELTKPGGLREDVYNISCAIEDIGDYRQQEQSEAEINGDYRLRKRVTNSEVNDDDYSQGDVIEKTPRLPELDGVGREVAEIGTIHDAEYKANKSSSGVTLVAQSAHDSHMLISRE